MQKPSVYYQKYIFYLCLVAFIIFFWWKILGNTYINGSKPIGGDYFNALTYEKYFKENLTLPPLGWEPFWNEGSPVIGGYPWLFYYLTSPLSLVFDLSTAVELSASLTILIFFLASSILFKLISKNWLITAALTLILMTTKASYYQLTVGGFISAATAQWYLPVILIFLYLYNEKKKQVYLILASIFSGLSLLHHAPTSLLMIFAPTLVVLILNKKIKDVVTFVILSLLIGSMGLYTLLLQTFLGSGNSACVSPECWGVYPRHLITWMNVLAPAMAISLVMFTFISKFIKKSTKLKPGLTYLFALSIIIIYALAAYFKLINGIANVIFPTRTFWAANFLMLAAAAAFFGSINKSFKKLSLIASVSISTFIIAFTFILKFDLPNDFVNSDPAYIANYIDPKYKTGNISNIIPDSIPVNDTNWRMDTFDDLFTHWWNYAYAMPSVRGYSNHPLGIHNVWQYFLQYSTREPIEKDQELTKNRALFLLDAFGVGYHENSVASYPQIILGDNKIIKNINESNFYEISQNYVTPIIFPTNSPGVLFVGNNAEYENFIRVLAMVNLNSQILIPVKGPDNIDKLSPTDFSIFKALVIYKAAGSNWSRINEYTKTHGKVIIDKGNDNILYETVKNDDLDKALNFKERLLSIIDKPVAFPDFDIQRPNPGKIIVTAKNITGIYFKENYDSGWTSPGHSIYKAGLDFMYIPISESVSNIDIFYRGSFTAWFLFVITMLTIAVSFLYILLPNPINRAYRKIKSKSLKWLLKEELEY